MATRLTYQSYSGNSHNKSDNGKPHNYFNGARYNPESGTFSTPKGQYGTQEEYPGPRRSFVLSMPALLMSFVCFAYYLILKERFSDKPCRAVLDQTTGRILIVGKGKSKPVITKPNKNPSRDPALNPTHNNKRI